MEIHRSHPESGFTILPDAILRDPRLSYLARGVLAEILSRPDDWATSADAIWHRARRERGKAGEGRDVLRAAFAELATAGYLHRQKHYLGRRKLRTELHVFDAPDGLEAWLAAEAFRAQVVDNSPSADVPADGINDGTGRRRYGQGKHGVSADGINDGLSGVDGSGVDGSGVDGSGVITETYDGDLSTETLNGNQADGNHTRLLTEPAEVEGARARPGQERSISDEEWEQRERVAARVLGPLPQAAPAQCAICFCHLAGRTRCASVARPAACPLVTAAAAP